MDGISGIIHSAEDYSASRWVVLRLQRALKPCNDYLVVDCSLHLCYGNTFQSQHLVVELTVKVKKLTESE